ncbi:MAG: EpsG family protein [Candidatus Margulisbacteria bacterium]|nr:EpsG family protein [Candidatus Margulisiibacteriota bacterium]
MIASIFFFVVMCFGLGFGLVKVLKLDFRNSFEMFFMSIGFGLGIFPILATFLNLIHIPLHWLTFLVLAVLGPLGYLYKREFKLPKFEIKLTKDNFYFFIIVLIAAVLFVVYLKGAFAYPYFEDDDPWGHAIGTTYIAEHKTYSRYVGEEITSENFFRTYMEPYPPAYDALMGVLLQTNDSVMWTLKFFNVLIIALGLVFFYFFAVRFSQNSKKALTATFIIAVLPCFMSHFIWAQTLALVLFFPAFYCFERLRENRKWAVLGMIIIASIFVSQPSSAVFFASMFGLYWVSKLIVSYFNKEKVFARENNFLIISLIAGIGLSMVYWIPTLIKYGLEFTMRGVGIVMGLFGADNVDTSAGIVYNVKDYMVAPLASKMDQPIGVGIVVFFLVLFGIFLLVLNYKKIKVNYYFLTILIWLAFTLIGTEGNALPFKLFPHRFWAFFAIPIAFLTAEALVGLSKLLKKPAIKYPILLVIFVGILWTSGYPKYVVETSMWPPGATWSSGEELKGYISLANQLPKNTPIFNVCSHEGKLLAFEMYTPPYDPDLFWFKLQIENKTLDNIYSVAKEGKFDYIVIDGYCTRRMSVNQTNQLLQEAFNSTKFEPVSSTQAFWLFKVS